MKKLVLLYMTLAPLWLWAQDRIETDRPEESQSTQTVSKGRFQAEFGLRKNRKDETDYTVQHPNILLRLGLFQKTELRLQTAWETDKLFFDEEFKHGLRSFELGLKRSIFLTKDSGFSTSIVAHVGIPDLASKDYKADHAFHKIRLLFENTLTNKLTLNYNIGTDWNEEEQEQNWVYTFSPQYKISNTWKVFVEDYSFFQAHHKPEHYIDIGVMHHLSNNLQADVIARKGISQEASKYMIEMGLSFRL